MAKRGRPTILTDEVAERIVRLMRDGTFLVTAASLAGIGESTLRNWLRKGADARARRQAGERLSADDQRVADFLIGFERATAEWELQALAAIVRIDETRALIWRLEHRFPDRWGKKSSVTITHAAPTMPISERANQDDPIRSLYAPFNAAA